jgi:hypothetical protein
MKYQKMKRQNLRKERELENYRKEEILYLEKQKVTTKSTFQKKE